MFFVYVYWPRNSDEGSEREREREKGKNLPTGDEKALRSKETVMITIQL